jgi:hypothetical protein
MWASTTSRVGVTMGWYPNTALAEMFSDRIHLITATLYTTGAVPLAVRIYFQYATPTYIKNNRIARVVFNLTHPDAATRSTGPNLGLCHPILTVERFFDLATLLSLAHVPNPMFPSYSGAYMKHRPRALVVPISMLRQKNVSCDHLAGDDLPSRKGPDFDTHVHLGDEG